MNNKYLVFLAKVTIQTPPPPMVVLEPGDLFTITCTAVGVPAPEVIWRLNWGHIPEKCNSSSVNGFGTLICPNIQVICFSMFHFTYNKSHTVYTFP